MCPSFILIYRSDVSDEGYLIGNALSRLGRFYIWLSQLFSLPWKKKQKHVKFLPCLLCEQKQKGRKGGRGQAAGLWGLVVLKREGSLGSKGAGLLDWKTRRNCPTRSGTWKSNSWARLREGAVWVEGRNVNWLLLPTFPSTPDETDRAWALQWEQVAVMGKL